MSNYEGWEMDVPKIGDTIYTAGDSKDDDIWDDTELIAHWDNAVEEYRRQFGKETKPPFSNIRETNEAFSSTEKEVRSAGKTTKQTGQPNEMPQQTYQQDTCYPPPPPPTHSGYNTPSPISGLDDEQFSRLIMAWYYSGYYTGYYQK
ncbi:hypothetical protein DFQ29_004820 [Apophysomyces sp. BC1021]|nr:hypothetical protein DFQ29_004820 [Apophysomyces sp. BC1021]